MSTDTPPVAGHHLAIAVLGGFRFWVRGHDALAALPGGSQRLLAFLALRDRSVMRSAVAGTLWPEASEDHAHASLRSAISRLTVVAHEAVLVTSQELRLAEDVHVDLREGRALAHRLINPVEQASKDDLSEAAVSLLSAELLPDWYDDWAVIEAEDWRQLRLHALDALTGRLTVARQFGLATSAALAAVRAEPLRETAHAALIQVYLAEGNRAEALAAFERYRSILQSELGLGPSPAIEGLAANL